MKCMQKFNDIAKISCYFERSVVTLKLHKKYLNTMTYSRMVVLEVASLLRPLEKLTD